jgi:hypothetical protein
MTEKAPTSRATYLQSLSLLWRFFAAPQALLVLLGLVVFALVLSMVIPQIPPQALEDPQAWLAVQPGILGQRSDLFHALGLFDIHHAFWFHLLLALVGLTLFVWLVESADLAWRAMHRERWTPATFASWGRHAPQIRLSAPHEPQDSLAQLRDLLSQRGYWSVDVSEMSIPNLVAGRRELFFWAEPLVYGALLVVLVGLVIVGNWGWQSRDWQPAPGESWAVGHGTAYAVRLDAFELQQDKEGRLLGYHSDITWLEDGAKVSQDQLAVGRPAMLRGVAVRQVGYVPAVKIRGRDDAGHLLALQAGGEELSASGEVEITIPAPDAQQLLLIPAHDLFLALTFEPLCVGGKPALHVALLRESGAEQQPLAALYESGLVDVENLQFEVDLDYRPILRVDHRPAMGLVVGGLALAVIALAAGWLVPPRLLWIAVGPGEEGSTLIQILALPGARGSWWLPHLADHLREVLADEA